MNIHNPVEQFISDCVQALSERSFVKLTLNNYKGAEEQLNRIHMRRIVIKREEKLSFTYQYKTRDIVKNYRLTEAMSLVSAYIASDFYAALLYTTSGDLHFQRHPDGKVKLKKMAATHTEPAEAGHDRLKKRFIQPEGKAYLHALNITDAQGHVHKNAQDKYRQIDKYVEILSGLIKEISPQAPLKIVDMGCGKGYLTFALYDYVTHSLELACDVVGVDTRADMVALCTKIAADSGFSHLRFVRDSIADYPCDAVNILIALHACDTATDEAIAKGIHAGAELIVVAPCCHKQIRKQMHKTAAENDVQFLTKHGIFEERQAEMVTDGIRAMILEYFGYSTKIFEFISDAHTPKNVMIVGMKTKNAPQCNSALLEKIQKAKSYFGIEHHALEGMLKMG